MKKLPLLLVSMLAVSSAAFAETPVERQRLTKDGIGIQQTQARPEAVNQARPYEAQNNQEVRKEKRMHHKKHNKMKKDEANKEAKEEKAKK